jgi:hypothetical protein
MPTFCEDLSHIAKYAKRDSPPANANSRGCRGKIAIGNDNLEYMSVRRKDGIHTWKKVDTGFSVSVSPRKRKRRSLSTRSPKFVIRRSPSPRRRRRSAVISPWIFFERPRYIPYSVPRRASSPTRHARPSPSQRQAIARRAEEYIRRNSPRRASSPLQRARDAAADAVKRRSDRRADEIRSGER